MWTWDSPNGVTHAVYDTGNCATCGRRHDKPSDYVIMPTAFGAISGIMSGIVVKAQVALSHPKANENNAEEIYREALTRILAEAERAECIWSQYINRELPEHADKAKE
jgi:hypothetical protein